MLKFNMVIAPTVLSLVELELKENMDVFKDYIKYQ